MNQREALVIGHHGVVVKTPGPWPIKGRVTWFIRRPHALLVTLSMVVAGATATACGTSDTQVAAPAGGGLAIRSFDESSGGGDSALTGQLALRDECWGVTADKTFVFVVWSETLAPKVADSTRLQVKGPQGETLTLRPDDQVTLGGATIGGGEAGRSAQDVLKDTRWVSEPSPACLTNEVFAADSIAKSS